MNNSSIVLVGAFFAFSAFLTAQTPVEENFARNKVRYKCEHFVMGEDATSGYDYLFYKNGSKIVKIRSIWSASYTRGLRIEDLFFNGGLVLMRKWTGSKRNFAALKAGRNAALTPKEELYFNGAKLTRWVENGKAVDPTDRRWAETERSILEYAKSEIENYAFLKGDKR